MAGYDAKILKGLLDSYERSLLSWRKNKVTVHIAFPFTRKNLPEYFNQSSLAYEEIHSCMKSLEEQGDHCLKKRKRRSYYRKSPAE